MSHTEYLRSQYQAIRNETAEAGIKAMRSLNNLKMVFASEDALNAAYADEIVNLTKSNSLIIETILSGVAENIDITFESQLIVQLLNTSLNYGDPSSKNLAHKSAAAAFEKFSYAQKKIFFSAIQDIEKLDELANSAAIPRSLKDDIRRFKKGQELEKSKDRNPLPAGNPAELEFAKLRADYKASSEEIIKIAAAKDPETIYTGQLQLQKILIKIIMLGHRHDLDIEHDCFQLTNSYSSFELQAADFENPLVLKALKNKFHSSSPLLDLSKAQQNFLFDALHRHGQFEFIADSSLLPRVIKDRMRDFLKTVGHNPLAKILTEHPSPEEAAKNLSRLRQHIARYTDEANHRNEDYQIGRRTNSLEATRPGFIEMVERKLAEIIIYGHQIGQDIRTEAEQFFDYFHKRIEHAASNYNNEERDNFINGAHKFTGSLFESFSRTEQDILFSAMAQYRDLGLMADEEKSFLPEKLRQRVQEFLTGSEGNTAETATPADLIENLRRQYLDRTDKSHKARSPDESESYVKNQNALLLKIILIGHKANLDIKPECIALTAQFTVGVPLKSNRVVCRKGIKAAVAQFTKPEMDEIFATLHENYCLKEIVRKSDTTFGTILPQELKHAMQKWLKEAQQAKHDNVSRTAIENAPEAEDPIEVIEAEALIADAVEPPDIITIVEVDRLLIDGEKEELGPTLPRKRKTSGEEIPVQIQPRIDWIISSLQRDGFQLRDMIMYKEREEERSFADEFDEEAYKKSRYRILEISKDQHYFQVAVAEVVGKSTYVIREPIEFRDGDPVEVAKLKRRKDVFQISCYSPEQLVRQMRHCALTPFEELQEQLKTRIGWGDKKQAVVEIVGNYFIETGFCPPTGGQYIVDLGQYYKAPHMPEQAEVLTTYRRMYQAVLNHAIAGLEHVGNFRELVEDALGPLEPVAKPAPRLPFDAIQVFKNAAHHIQDHGTFPEDLDLEETLDNRDVTGLADVITGDITQIRTIRDVFIASGLAVQANDNIAPAPPAVIKQLVRLAELIAPAV